MALILAILVVAGCQTGPTTDRHQDTPKWRVLERTGAVRSTTPESRHAFEVRPGDMIQDGQLLTTGENAFLIIGSESAQLTLGEHTALTLPGPKGPSIIDLDRGWLRARLSTAADRTTRIRAEGIAVDASSATLTLQVSAKSIDLSIEDGNAVLTTTDGHHRAGLAAGAAAMRERSDTSPLLMRSAHHQPFSEVIPLRSEIDNEQTEQHDAENQSAVDLILPPKSKSVGSEEIKHAAGPHPPSTASRNTNSHNSDNLSTITILPASQRKSADKRTQMLADAVTSSHEPLISSVVKPAASASNGKPQAPSPRLMDPPHYPPPLTMQQSFDRLTDGLLDGLN